MANFTGEGKGLSALRSEMVRTLGANTGLSFNQAMQGLNALWPLILEAAKPADSALRLKLEKLVAELRDLDCPECTCPAKQWNHNMTCGMYLWKMKQKSSEQITLNRIADELSTLLTEESSQVGTKEDGQ